MDREPQITWKGLDASPSVEDDILEQIDLLENFFDHIIGCRVIVELPHRHQQTHALYHITVELSVPGKEIVVSRDPALEQNHDDVRLAVRDAFRAARRQLQDRVSQMRGHEKRHEPAPEGVVAQIFPLDGYGFLETRDGREVYFHANSVENDAFARLEIGAPVHFNEEPGQEGPQATIVRMMRPGRRPL